MTSEELLRQYGWILAAILAALFLLSRSVMRSIRHRREARAQTDAERIGDAPLVGPEGFRRARRQFILTLALLIVVVIVAVLTHFQ